MLYNSEAFAPLALQLFNRFSFGSMVGLLNDFMKVCPAFVFCPARPFDVFIVKARTVCDMLKQNSRGSRHCQRNILNKNRVFVKMLIRYRSSFMQRIILSYDILKHTYRLFHTKSSSG